MSASQRTTVIRSSGSYLPPQIVTNAMLSRIMDTTDEWILPRTGIRERRFVQPGVGPAELAEHAARAALEKASLTPADVDLIVFATMTPDHYFPGSGGLLAARLGMKSTHALDIRMQCAGFLSGLQTADAFIRSGTYDRVLLVGAEVHSGLMPWPESAGTSCSAGATARATRTGTRGRRGCGTARSSSATARARWSSRRTSRATGGASSASS
jgi:3-oxoacyl-[acyl-carrier-protein] synthase-3